MGMAMRALSFNPVAAQLMGININVIIAFTFGLLIPWAAVRVARYRAEALSLESSSDFEGFVGKLTQDVSATGEEIGEFFALDLSL